MTVRSRRDAAHPPVPDRHGIHAEDAGRPALGRRAWLAATLGTFGSAVMATAPAQAWATPPSPSSRLSAREALAGIDPAPYLASEKYDGVRGVWTGRELRFRSGARIAAPGWFTERLPAAPLEGELWMGRGAFEAVSAAVRRERPHDDEWRALRFMAFELPGADGDFAARAARIEALVRAAAWPQLVAVAQQRLPDARALARRFDDVVGAGGEGLVLHRATAPWQAGRGDALVKIKPLHDAEAVVVGHLPGLGKHAGRLGALQVETPEGRRFALGTGLSDAQRDSPPPLGSAVTYTYRGFTDRGLPRFASFLRVRPANV